MVSRQTNHSTETVQMFKQILKALFMGWLAKRFARRANRRPAPRRY